MFGKKKADPQPFNLQVLTPEYLIEGLVKGDTYLHVGFYLHLKPAKIQSTQSSNISLREVSQFLVQSKYIVAIIPGVDIEQLPQYPIWKDNKSPLLGDFYVGPYLLRGTRMGQDSKSPPLLLEEELMYDLRITCQTERTAWVGLYAPFALVNTNWLHGFVPDEPV